MEFSEKLVQLRKDKGLSQQELADTVFVSRSAVAKWESGRGIPDKANLEALCALFGENAEELLSEEERDVFRTRMLNRSISIVSMIFSAVFMVILTFPMTWHPIPGHMYDAYVHRPYAAFCMLGFTGCLAMLFFAALLVFSVLSITAPKVKFSRANNLALLLSLLVLALFIFVLVLFFAMFRAGTIDYNWFFVPQY